MEVVHVKVEDYSISKDISTVSSQAERCKVVQGTEIAEENQRDQEWEEVPDPTHHKMRG